MNQQNSAGLSAVGGLVVLLAAAAPLLAQQPEAPAPRPARAPINIIADNLNRAAATAAQLLEILNKDAGLMVEFKQLLAREAGLNGQILEEADLDEAAIAERLRSELRARVLATALLRKYGYLVPKINPDSDLAAEHNLGLRERTQEIERAADRGSAGYPEASLEYRVTCREQNARRCASTETPSKLEKQPREETPSYRPGGEASLLRAADVDVPNELQPDALNTPRELAASFGVDQGSSTPAPEVQGRGGVKRDRFDSSIAPDLEEIAAGRISSPNNSFGPTTPILERPQSQDKEFTDPAPRTVSPFALPRSNAEGRASELEPVSMRRRPSPYADVPSLYDLYLQAAPSGKKMERFGLDIFQRGAANPDNLPMDLPVGPDYVVGPGDGLSLNLWGSVSERLFRTVDREGRVVLPEVGAVLVAGRTLGAVQEDVERALRTQFRHISADVSLLRLRTVRVYVVGEVTSPGAYDISSLSTPLNALFAAGGVTPSGSLRRLEHFRGKQLLEEVDAYDLLLHGIRGEVQRLENGDSLRVPSVGASITVDGMVRRPATYELRREKNLSEVLDLAGGILPAAALQHIEVQRLQAHEKRTMLSLEIGENSNKEKLRSALENFLVQDGDEIHIFPIAPYNSDAVFLEGHVLRPGRYSYRQGMQLKDLVSSYKDLLPEPSESYAEIIHIAAPDYRPVVESFRLADVLEHPESGPVISPLDTVRIFGRYDFEPAPEVLISGEVHAPGRYRTSGQQRLRDALYQAGGLTSDAWLQAGQIFRDENDGTTHAFSVNLRKALQGDPSDNLVVEPRDRILVHRQPQKVYPASVTIRGEVARPGRYPLTDGMRVSDLLQSAGGALRSANAVNSDLNHYPRSSAENFLNPPTAQKVDLTAALGGDDASNMPLRDGDVLTVPQQAHWKDMGATVSISGEVARPGSYGIQPGERLSSVLRRAGGLLPTAYPQAAELERVTVRERQEQSRQEMIQRLEQESVIVKTSVTTSGNEEAALRQSAIQQKERVLEALRKAPVSGRLVIHLRQGRKDFAGSSDDVELRPGDTLRIPKQPGFVLVLGQVYNSNAITFRAGKSADWYLSRAGGPTPLANKSAIFILRSDGEVTGSSGRLWSGGALRSSIGPGDTIVVPEKPVLGAGNTWKNIVAIAQIAQAAALAAAVAIP
jgi:polysaccharide biosynthesis/export protein